MIVSKYLNGSLAPNYPKTYDGRGGFTTPGPNEYYFAPLDEASFAQLDEGSYGIRLGAFKIYVNSVETGMTITTVTTSPEPVLYDPIRCHTYRN